MLAHKQNHRQFLQYGAAYGVNIGLQFIVPKEDLESKFFVNSFCTTQFFSAVSLLFHLLQSNTIPGVLENSNVCFTAIAQLTVSESYR